MEKEQQDEFSTVKKVALRKLRTGKLASAKLATRICQYLILPSFANPICWEITSILTQDGKSHRLYRTEWRYDVDSQAFRSPVVRLKHPRPYRPTFDTGYVELNSKELYTILAQLSDVSVPLFCDEHAAGLDGVSYELKLGEYFCSASIRWWSRLPRNWRSLQPVMDQLVNYMKDAWARKPEATV